VKKILLIGMIVILSVVFASNLYARCFYHHEDMCDIENCPRKSQVSDTTNNVDDAVNEVTYYDCGNPNCHRTDEHTHYQLNNGYHHGNGQNHSHGRHHR